MHSPERIFQIVVKSKAISNPKASPIHFGHTNSIFIFNFSNFNFQFQDKTKLTTYQTPGGGVTLRVHGTGLCHFLGYLFHDRLRIYGYGFQQFSVFSEFMGMAFCTNSLIGDHFQNFRIYVYDFQKIFRIFGYTFQKFVRIYGWHVYDLNGTTQYLGNSSDPPGLEQSYF